MTRDELHDLPATVDVPTAGRVLGIGRTLAYHLVRTGQWPTPVLRAGKLIKIPSGPLIRLVEASAPEVDPGIEGPSTAAQVSASGQGSQAVDNPPVRHSRRVEPFARRPRAITIGEGGVDAGIRA